MNTKKLLAVILCLGLCGCATLNSSPVNQFQKFPLVGRFQNNNEPFIGRIKVSLSGNTFIEIKGGISGITCNGLPTIVYNPPDGEALGRKGEATLNCADGRVMNAEFTCTSHTSGYGSGTDHYAVGSDPNATDFAFTYGMNENDTLQYIAKEQAEEQNKNVAVMLEHYKKLMVQIKEDQATINPQNNYLVDPQTLQMIADYKALRDAGVFDTPEERARKNHPYLMALASGMQAFGAGLTHQSYYTGGQSDQGQSSYMNYVQMYNSLPIRIYDNSFHTVGYIQNDKIYNNEMQNIGYMQDNKIFDNQMHNTGYVKNDQIYNNQMQNIGRIQKNN